MQVEIIRCLKDNYSYLVIDKQNKLACVIDPSEAKPIINFLEEKNINLKFILNTHHHYDHVGGNSELKKKYNAKVVGFIGDKDRIPEIDIFLKDREIWKYENFESKIFHIPGHTSGHICYNFFKDKLLFTGDTLFSLGCGRIFEGTYEQMLNSLNLLKTFHEHTKIYCGHEYTRSNADFALTIEKNNNKLIKRFDEINNLINENSFTVPTTIEKEIETNPFLRADNNNIKKDLEMNSASTAEIFGEIRKRKDKKITSQN